MCRNRVSHHPRLGLQNLQTVVRAEVERPLAGYDSVDLASGKSVVGTVAVYFVSIITEKAVVGSQPGQSVFGARDCMDRHRHITDGDVFPEQVFRGLCLDAKDKDKEYGCQKSFHGFVA